jgi:GTP-binding protein EngB required for normal cell division
MNTTPSATAKQRAAIDLKSLAYLMGEVDALCHKQLGLPVDEQFRARIQTTHLGLFRLVVMGEIKKGKSSFINALCGIKDLVPELTDVATSSIFKIRYGKERSYEVFFKQKGSQTGTPKLAIRHEQLGDYGTEAGNPGNQKGVDFIAVQAPSPILKDGLIIVDTPGVGGLFKEHREITWKYAPNSDAIFFVTDSIESPLGAEEVDFIKELRKITGYIYFIQTKTDRVDRDAANKRMENNLQILESKAGIPRDQIIYFQVSSKLKCFADESNDVDDLQASGFIPLIKFLNIHLKAAKDRNIATVSLGHCQNRLNQALLELEQRRQLLDANSKEKMELLEKEIKNATRAVQEWQTQRAPAMQREVNRAIQELFADVTKEIGKILRPGGEISENIRIALSQMKSTEEVYGKCMHLVKTAQADAAERINRATKSLSAEVETLLHKKAVEVGAQLAGAITPKSEGTVEIGNHVALEQLTAKAATGLDFNTIRTGFYGGSLGVAICATAGGLIGSVVPVVGTIIGSNLGLILGGLLGGALAVDSQKTQELERARTEVLGTLEREMVNWQASVQADLNKLQGRLIDFAQDTLKTIALQTQEKLVQKQRQIDERRKMDGDALARERSRVERLNKEVDRLQKQLDEWKKRV